VYTVHTHSSLPSALLSSYRTPRCSMTHPASGPPRDPRILNRSVAGVDEVFRRNQKILPNKRHTMPPVRAPGFEAKTLRFLGWRGPAKAIMTKRRHSERLEGSSREARPTQSSGGGHDRQRQRTRHLGDLGVHHHPCFCICIGGLDVPRMHAVASPRCSSYSLVRREAEKAPAGKMEKCVGPSV
jgi:hypothetical protein